MTCSFNLADLFEGAADALAEQEAVVAGGADRATVRRTYAELDRQANRVAALLADQGVGAGDHVGVHLTNCVEFIEIILGVFKLRAVPININHRYTADEIAYVLDDADVRVVVTQPEPAEMRTAVADAATLAADPVVVFVVGPEFEQLLAIAPDERPDGSQRSGDDRYLLYTGGTTGMPKGVVWRHEDLFFGALGGTGAPRQGLPKLDDPAAVGDWVRTGTGITRRLPLCPLIHGGAQWIALTALLTGGTCLLSTDLHFDAEAAWAFAAAERAEFLMIIGDAVARPLADALDRSPGAFDLRALRLVSSSGAILSPAVLAALQRHLPDVRIIDRFGASETGGQGRIRRDGDRADGITLVSDDHTSVLDDDLRPVEPGSGVRGRLARRGWIPLGYWRDETKTAAAFPIIDGVRHSVPGDIATVEADGSITVFGRGSMVINTGGEKVFPEEVEAAVKGHPKVFDALVVGIPDERFGARVAAVVAPVDRDDPPTLEELDAHCRTELAGYKVPRALVVVDEVQRKVTGKGDYGWARDRAAEEEA